jgi:CheY-like chemotaxis protein
LVFALHYELQLYADGAMFSYAVAVQDVWAFHWHNISARLSVFILTLLPAELYVGLTGSPLNGIRVYGFLFYGAPLFSLIGTFIADRSIGRIIFTYACGSTALLCPLIFGFPTEMWLAHALFWLLVNPVNQQVASRILERRGHAVVVVGDGRAAVEALEGSHGFDAVLMDVQMPEMDGLAATGAIREHERAAGGRVPIIAMTAHAMKGDRERCLQAGMDGYVSKPVEADHLIEAVETAAGSFDPSRAAARLGGDASLLRELLDLFLSDLPRMTGEIERAIRTKDAEALRRAAHALKGSVANFAAAGPVDAARRLEVMGASGDLTKVKEAFAELSTALTTFTKDASKGRAR